MLGSGSFYPELIMSIQLCIGLVHALWQPAHASSDGPYTREMPPRSGVMKRHPSGWLRYASLCIAHTPSRSLAEHFDASNTITGCQHGGSRAPAYEQELDSVERLQESCKLIDGWFQRSTCESHIVLVHLPAGGTLSY